MKRRDVLRALPLLPLSAAGMARAIGARSEVGIGKLRHGGTWDTRPDAARRWLWEVAKRTSINAARDATVVDLAPGTGAPSTALFEQPFVLLTGTGDMPAFSPEARARLDRHLRFGGTLVVDAPGSADPFVAAVKRELAAVLPSSTLRPLDADHVIYKSFFLLDGAVGRVKEDRTLEAIDVGDRAAVIVSTNDLCGALDRDRFGAWRFPCEPDGDGQRELAMRLAVNLLMYATCIDYKADQVHIPFIMKKKRR